MAPQLNPDQSSLQAGNQSPQLAPAPGNGGVAASGVQSGTPTDALNSHTGIPLSAGPLSVVTLRGGSGTIATPSHTTQRHINAPLMGLAIGLLLIAAVLFALTSRSVKSTT